MAYSRGAIKAIQFEIEYPDGSRKKARYVVQDKLRAVLCSDKFMDESMKKKFNVSATDWTKNPAMIIVDGRRLCLICRLGGCVAPK